MTKKISRRRLLSLSGGTAALIGGLSYHSLTGPVTILIINDDDSNSELNVDVRKGNNNIFDGTISVPANTTDSPAIAERKIIDRAMRGDEYTIELSVSDRSYLSDTIRYTPTCTGFVDMSEGRLTDEIRVAIPGTSGPRDLQVDSNYCGGFW